MINRIGCTNGSFLSEDQGSRIWKGFTLQAELKAGKSSELNRAKAFLCVADLSGITLRGRLPVINLAGVDLRGADLRGADLRQVKLEDRPVIDGQAILLRANTADVIYDESTRWPAGFQPATDSIPSDSTP